MHKNIFINVFLLKCTNTRSFVVKFKSRPMPGSCCGSMRSVLPAEAILEGGGASGVMSDAIGRHTGPGSSIGLLVQYSRHVRNGHCLLGHVEFRGGR